MEAASLYQEGRETLVKMCSESGLITTGKKHELVRRMAENNACYEDPVTLDESELYDGDVESILSSSAGLIRLSVAQLRHILRTHRVLEVGTKEELVVRVGLRKAGYPEAAFSRERLCILHTIEVAQEIEKLQDELNLKTISRRRKFEHGQENTLTTRTSCLKDVLSRKTPSLDVDSGQKWNVQSALEALRVLNAEKEEASCLRVEELERSSSKLNEEGRCKKVKTLKDRKEKVLNSEGRQKVIERPQRSKRQPAKLRDQPGELKGRGAFAVGQTLEVLWSEKDLEGMNWKPGWYRGEVQHVDEENDVVYIWYHKDRAVYSLDATGALVDGIIRQSSN